jgi:hypothetical protein
MRDDLLSKIKQEAQSRERALKSFQEARTLTTEQAKSRMAILVGPLQQLTTLQQGIERMVQVATRGDDTPSAAEHTLNPPKNPPSAPTPSEGTETVDRGEWANG